MKLEWILNIYLEVFSSVLWQVDYYNLWLSFKRLKYFNLWCKFHFSFGKGDDVCCDLCNSEWKGFYVFKCSRQKQGRHPDYIACSDLLALYWNKVTKIIFWLSVRQSSLAHDSPKFILWWTNVALLSLCLFRVWCFVSTMMGLQICTPSIK